MTTSIHWLEKKSRSAIDHWGFTGTGNRSGDPLFENHAADDYHLQAGSPCIDSGTPTMADTDIDGVSRPQGAGYDMGACEFHQP